MSNFTSRLTLASAIALTVAVTSGVHSEPASAQILDVVSGTINSLINKKPQPVPNRNLTLGTNNLNGNTLNLCVMPCSPTGSAPIPNVVPVSPVPQQVAPAPVGFPQQSSVSQTQVFTRTGTVPPGVIPQGVNPGVAVPPGVIPQGVNPGVAVPPGVIPQGVPVPPQAVQPTPPRPTLVIPPIKLPVNLPL